MGLVSSIYGRSCKQLDDDEKALRRLIRLIGKGECEAWGDYARAHERRHREFSPEQQREIRNATARLQRKESLPYKTARIRCENDMRRKITGPTRQERELDEAVAKLEKALTPRG